MATALEKSYAAQGKKLPPRRDEPLTSSQLSQDDSPLIASVPTARKARLSGIGEPQNLSTMADVERVQSAIRTAERGDTWQLFTLYRDMVVGFGHLQAEWAKRKMVVVGQPHSIIPHSKSANDVLAANVIKQMIDKCENWMDGMNHLLEASLYPVAVCEKLFRAPDSSDNLEFPVRYLLKRLEVVEPILLCFRGQYQNGPGGIQDYDPNSFEPSMRIYNTNDNGVIDFSLINSYKLDPSRHIAYRGNFLSRAIRDNFGGQMRAILFWWLLATKGRDWWGLFMQKYGSPFIVGKVDAQQSDTVAFLRQQFQMATAIGGIVVDKRAEVELEQAAAADGANAHKSLISVCNDEVSKIIVGQTLSSSAKNTGLGSGMADFHGEVRDDIRLYDMMKLSETNGTQLFAYYLAINGIRANPPKMIWGGKRDGDASVLAGSLSSLKLAGIQPTEEALGVLSERLGYSVERAPEPVMKDPKKPL